MQLKKIENHIYSYQDGDLRAAIITNPASLTSFVHIGKTSYYIKPEFFLKMHTYLEQQIGGDILIDGMTFFNDLNHFQPNNLHYVNKENLLAEINTIKRINTSEDTYSIKFWETGIELKQLLFLANAEEFTQLYSKLAKFKQSNTPLMSDNPNEKFSIRTESLKNQNESVQNYAIYDLIQKEFLATLQIFFTINSVLIKDFFVKDDLRNKGLCQTLLLKSLEDVNKELEFEHVFFKLGNACNVTELDYFPSNIIPSQPLTSELQKKLGYTFIQSSPQKLLLENPYVSINKPKPKRLVISDAINKVLTPKVSNFARTSSVMFAKPPLSKTGNTAKKYENVKNSRSPA